MTLPSSKADYDIIATQILLDAKQALANLKAIGQGINDTDTRLKTLQGIVSATATKMGGDFGRAEKAVQRFSGAISGIKSEEIRQAANLARETNIALEGTGDAAHRGIMRALTAVNALRIAMGALVAMLLFGVINAFKETFFGAIDQARALEDTMYRLGNVEKILSNAGTEVTMKGLEEGITRIQKLMPIFSREDVAELVGGLATATSELGYSEKQIIDLAQAIAVLNVNSTESESLLQTQGKVITALLSGTTKGISSLGVQLNDQVIVAKALEMGFLRAGEGMAELTKHEKDLAKLTIILERGKELGEDFNGYLDTNTAKIQANKAAWSDLLTTIGQGINNLIPNIVPALEKIQKAFELKSLNKLVRAGAPNIGEGASFMDASIWFKIATGIKFTSKEYERLKTILAGMSDEDILKLFPDPSAIKDRFTRELIQSVVETPDTATGPGSGGGGAGAISEEDMAKSTKAMEDYQNDLSEIMLEGQRKRADLERDYGRKLQDIARDYSQKLADIARNTEEKREDALRNLNQKIEDINRDSNQAIQDAQEDFRNKELDREKDYQNKLRELQDKFLFDLEDALHERDARQILRLIRQFNLDKKNLEEKRKLDEQQSKVDLQKKIADIERERALKLEAAQREYDEKLEEIAIGEQRALEEAAIWRRRQLEDAKLWHQREIAEQREYLKRKLEDLAKALAAELNMTSMTAKQIANIMNSVLGAGINIPLTTSGGTIPTFPSNSFSDTFKTLTGGMGYGYAEGGSVVANRPTRAVFGERGAEMATFTPLNRTGRDVGKVFGDLQMGQGAGGSLALQIGLSDGLVGEIVDTSLEHVSAHIERIRRTR